MALPNQSAVSFETCSSSDDQDSGSPQITLRGRSGIVFITGANESKQFLFEAAKKADLEVIVIDSAESAGTRLLEAGVVDRFIQMELLSDTEEAAHQCCSAIQSLELPIQGIVTFMEMSVFLASRVAELMKLPGLPSASVAVARDKRLTREMTSRAGLANPAVASIKCEADVEASAQAVGFPAVLKPIIGADSLGVKRVDSIEELRVAFLEAKRVMSSVVISAGFLSCPTEPKSMVVFGENTEPVLPPVLPVEFLLEEYLDGPEVDIDLLLFEGACLYAAVSDNGQTIEPYFTETYGILPSLLSREDQQALTKLAIDSALAIGLTSGVFHVEAKLTSRGPRLIEVNARLGGGPICEMHKRVAGIDLAHEQILISAGLGPSFKTSNSHTPTRAFAYMTTNAVSSGRVGERMEFLETFRATASKLSCRVKPGMYIVGPEEGQPTWLTEIWMERPLETGGKSPNAVCADLVSEICKTSDQIATEFARNYVH